MVMVRIIMITTQLSLIIRVVITTGVVNMGVVTVIREIIRSKYFMPFCLI